MAAHTPDQARTGVAGVMISRPEAPVIPRPGRYEIDTSCSTTRIDRTEFGATAYRSHGHDVVLRWPGWIA
jgi:hypothetical protein